MLGKAHPMALNRHFTGREERRLPVMMEAKLAPAHSTTMERREKAHVENISTHGARVYASGPWQLGEQVEITPIGERSIHGEVIYCHKLADGRFVVGLQVQRDLVLSSILERLRG